MKLYKLFVFSFLAGCATYPQNDLLDLGIGQTNLHQSIKVKNLEKGIRFFDIERGEISDNDFYTLSSSVITEPEQKELSIKLKKLGFSSRIEYPAEKGPHGEFLGFIIRIGRFKHKEEAEVANVRLIKQGIKMTIRYTAEDGNATSGPFKISVLEIDLNQFKGNIFSDLAQKKIQGKESISSISNRHNAMVAVNAGFFTWKKELGTEGDPAGISIIDGELVSEATNGRDALIINNNLPKKIYVAHDVRTEIVLSIDRHIFEVNGVNRMPGKILNCGNVLSSGFEKPIHDFVCHNLDEIVVFDKNFGRKSVEGEGIEFVLDEEFRVKLISEFRGGKIPELGYIIQATGAKAEALKPILKLGMSISLTMKVSSNEGPIVLEKGIYAINGGPTLIQNDSSNLSSRYTDGWETLHTDFQVTDKYVDKKDDVLISDKVSGNRNGFYYDWILRRHPRTAVGITKDNKVYVVAVYGRQPGVSAGASITEMSTLMKNLGAQDAFNLDGGGSTMMVVDGMKTGESSDQGGEREVGDALIFTKK